MPWAKSPALFCYCPVLLVSSERDVFLAYGMLSSSTVSTACGLWRVAEAPSMGRLSCSVCFLLVG